MARIRTVKPEYWTDERVGECSVSARLLFIATWNFADDHGGLDRSSKQLKAQAFPYDNIDCEPLVQELLNNGLLVEYEVEGKKYLHIKGFGTHQKVEKKGRPRVPVYNDTLKSPRLLPDSSPTSADSSLEGKGRESKGSKNPSASATPTRKAAPSEAAEEPGWLATFRLVYPNRAGDQGWRKAARAAHARMAEGHATAEFIAGARRYAAFCEAAGKTGTEYVKQACTFLGPDKGFLLPWHAPPKAETASERILRTLNGSDEKSVIEHDPQRIPLASSR